MSIQIKYVDSSEFFLSIRFYGQCWRNMEVCLNLTLSNLFLWMVQIFYFLLILLSIVAYCICFSYLIHPFRYYALLIRLIYQSLTAQVHITLLYLYIYTYTRSCRCDICDILPSTSTFSREVKTMPLSSLKEWK